MVSFLHPIQIENDLGLGPNGPLVVPPTTLSVVAFPKYREQLKVNQTCFTFLNPSDQDEDDEKKDLEESSHKKTPQVIFFHQYPKPFQEKK